jgi:hypothetical protein
MNPIGLLAGILVLQPVLDAPEPLRVVATGTGDHPVDWNLDGNLVATTADGEPGRFNASAGFHTLAATTQYNGPWQVLARPDPHAGGVEYVASWYAHSPGETVHLVPPGSALGAVALATLIAALRFHAKAP